MNSDSQPVVAAEKSEAEKVATSSPKERVAQIHKRCLNSIFATDYFKEVGRRVTRYAPHFDFAIGLGAALAGGSGLGILSNPNFAWLCGLLTTASVILTVAKSSYNWPARLKLASEMTEKYGRLSGKYLLLVDEMNYAREFNEGFEKTYVALRNEELQFSQEDYPDLSIDTERKIQTAIKQRIPYSEWWRPTQ